MNLTRVTRAGARGVAVAAMGAAVMAATADGFVQSYAGLLAWAHEHRVTGWKADSFPLLVDVFVMVGELGLFLLAIDGHKVIRKQMLTWVDLAIPAVTATCGWAVSLAFNVGRIRGGTAADQVTAAVPPVAAMVGLVILLRTLHRYVTATPGRPADAPAPDTGSDPEVQPPLADDGHAGQGVVHDLATAVRSAKAAGLSDRAISDAFEVSRYRVGKILADQPEPAPSVGGEDSGQSAELADATEPRPSPNGSSAADI